MKKNLWFGASALALGVFVAWLIRRPIAPVLDTSESLIHYRFRVVTKQSSEAQIEFLKRKIAAAPGDGMDLAALAGTYLSRAKLTGNTLWFDEAEKTAAQSLKNLPHENSAAKAVLAQVADARHDFDRAIKLSTEVVKERPRSTEGYAIRATSLLGTGRLDEAARDADTLVDIHPGPGAYTIRALVMEARGKGEEALFNFHKALSLEEAGDPEGSSYRRALLGRFHLRRGNLGTAENLFREALRIADGYPLAMGLIAELEARRQNYTAAEKQYYEAFLRVHDPLYLVNQARMKVALKDAKSAEAIRHQAESMLRQELDRGSYGHRLQLAGLLLDRGRAEDVKEAVKLAEAESQRRRNAETLSTLAWAEGKSGNWPRARSLMREVLHSGVENAEYFYRAGVIEKNLKNPSAAEFYLGRARSLDRTFDEAKNDLAELDRS